MRPRKKRHYFAACLAVTVLVAFCYSMSGDTRGEDPELNTSTQSDADSIDIQQRLQQMERRAETTEKLLVAAETQLGTSPESSALLSLPNLPSPTIPSRADSQDQKLDHPKRGAVTVTVTGSHSQSDGSGCAGWRQNGACGNGAREPQYDKTCDQTISAGDSGYCECCEGQEIRFNCKHSSFNCKCICRTATIIEACAEKDLSFVGLPLLSEAECRPKQPPRSSASSSTNPCSEVESKDGGPVFRGGVSGAQMTADTLSKPGTFYSG